jgi:hypothetical protein
MRLDKYLIMNIILQRWYLSTKWKTDYYLIYGLSHINVTRCMLNIIVF